jgi:hypothetical protein
MAKKKKKKKIFTTINSIDKPWQSKSKFMGGQSWLPLWGGS